MTGSGSGGDTHTTNSNSSVHFPNTAAAPLRLPPLSPLPAFEATARLGSMTLAAEELGRTHSAISRQIKALEEALGLELLDRGTAPLGLTTAGKTLYATARMAFEAFDSCMGQLRPSQGSETVTLAIGSSFATRWLVPRLPRFYALHPEISLRLTMVGASILEVDDYDLVTSWNRLGYNLPDDQVFHVLGDVSFALVCAPHYRFRLEAGRLRAETQLVGRWPITVQPSYRDHPLVVPITERTLAFPHIHMCIEAAVGGLGVTLVETRLAEPELADGRLIAPLGTLVIEGGLVAFPHRRREPKAATRKLLAWLKAEAGADQPRSLRDDV
jgi:DNA-binding transcriptional LysR family regulator